MHLAMTAITHPRHIQRTVVILVMSVDSPIGSPAFRAASRSDEVTAPQRTPHLSPGVIWREAAVQVHGHEMARRDTAKRRAALNRSMLSVAATDLAVPIEAVFL